MLTNPLKLHLKISFFFPFEGEEGGNLEHGLSSAEDNIS